MSGDRGGTKLQFTPTWSISLICSIIVLISLIVERRLHTLGKVNIKLLFPSFPFYSFLMICLRNINNVNVVLQEEESKDPV